MELIALDCISQRKQPVCAYKFFKSKFWRHWSLITNSKTRQLILRSFPQLLVNQKVLSILPSCLFYLRSRYWDQRNSMIYFVKTRNRTTGKSIFKNSWENISSVQPQVHWCVPMDNTEIGEAGNSYWINFKALECWPFKVDGHFIFKEVFCGSICI